MKRKRKYTTVSAKKGIAEMLETLYDNKRNKLNETERVNEKKMRNILDEDEKKRILEKKTKEHQKRLLPADVEAEIKEETTTNREINIKISLSK